MEDGKITFRSAKTGRQYKISRHYTCENTHLVYLAHCTLCNVDYVGQTVQQMRKRHLGHRAEIRGGAEGLGRHLLEKHGLICMDYNGGMNMRDETKGGGAVKLLYS